VYRLATYVVINKSKARKVFAPKSHHHMFLKYIVSYTVYNNNDNLHNIPLHKKYSAHELQVKTMPAFLHDLPQTISHHS